MTQSIFALILITLLTVGGAPAQTPLDGSGKNFSFSLPEGADRITQGNDTTQVFVRILSPFSGTGVIEAAGFTKDFTFSSNSALTIELPRSLVITGPTGAYNKGILVSTTQPVSLVLHRWMDYAGEATQIFPDDAQGTEFLVSSWGVFNDVGEDNVGQVVITGIYSETSLDIIPKIDGVAQTPIKTIIGRGESYILKADANTALTVWGYTGTTIKTSAPVSVMTNITCGYVPIGRQACNEMIDMLLPKKYFGTFYTISPLSDSIHNSRLVFTSDSMNFTVTSGRGLFQSTTNGRIEMLLTRPDVFGVSKPAQCMLLTGGYDVSTPIPSDPSFVSILPQPFWSDTLLWNSPPVRTENEVFLHYVSMIFPKEAASQVMLDDIPVNTLGVVQNIPQSQNAAMQIRIVPGNHRITSPVPVFAVASGFLPADAYTFLPVRPGQQTLSVNDRPSGSPTLRVSITPNPVSNTLYVTATGNQKVMKYLLYSATGQLVLMHDIVDSETTELDLSHLASGNYILEAVSSATRASARINIVR